MSVLLIILTSKEANKKITSRELKGPTAQKILDFEFSHGYRYSHTLEDTWEKTLGSFQPKLMTKIEVISQKPSKTGFLAKMAIFCPKPQRMAILAKISIFDSFGNNFNFCH